MLLRRDELFGGLAEKDSVDFAANAEPFGESKELADRREAKRFGLSYQRLKTVCRSGADVGDRLQGGIDRVPDALQKDVTAITLKKQWYRRTEHSLLRRSPARQIAGGDELALKRSVIKASWNAGPMQAKRCCSHSIGTIAFVGFALR